MINIHTIKTELLLTILPIWKAKTAILEKNHRPCIDEQCLYLHKVRYIMLYKHLNIPLKNFSVCPKPVTKHSGFGCVNTVCSVSSVPRQTGRV